jgi:GT2 family glycosyltransferase
LRLAIAQTRAAKEIIVVDASPRWDQTKEQVIADFAETKCTVPLVYVKAITPSLTAQRNQGIQLTTSDVVFLFDDDSLMYPQCAEEILKVYEADTDGKIMGVSAIPVSVPPELAVEEKSVFRTSRASKLGSFASWLRNLLKSALATRSTYFLPYEQSENNYPLPDSVGHLNIARIPIMTGSCMTFRRTILERERFCEVLQRYAAGEDQDLSYRVSRHGPLVVAIDAPLCHLEIEGGRLTTFQVTVLAALNPAVLQRLYGRDPIRLFYQWRRIIWHRLFINLLRDLENRNWLFPRTRGIAYSLMKIGQIYARSAEELAQWYPSFQRNLLEPTDAAIKPDDRSATS